jgi:hypothetical protein
MGRVQELSEMFFACAAARSISRGNSTGLLPIMFCPSEVSARRVGYTEVGGGRITHIK